jgi:hypothetical protein
MMRSLFLCRNCVRAVIVVVGCIAVVLSIVLGYDEAKAVPVFARKYNTTCFTCHTTPPLLNDFGLRFQANGYELPGTVEKFAQADQPNFLLGMVAQPMVNHQVIHDNLSNQDSSTYAFSGIEVALFTSASLGSHFSFYTGLPIDYFSGQQSTINVETANLIYTDALNDGTGSLNFRLGEFRFGIPYQHQVILANQDPLIYTYSPFDGKNVTTANTLSFADPNFGFSAFGMIPGIAEGLRYDVGYSGGTSSDIDLKTSYAFFGSLNQTFYVNNAPLRIGAFIYRGSQDVYNTVHIPQFFVVPDSDARLPGTFDTIPRPDSLVTSGWTNHTSRIGFNLEFSDPWTKRLDFYSQYLIGKDDNVDTVGTGYNETGGFVGLNVIVFPEKFYVYGRYDILKVKETNDNRNQIDVGFQYHLLPNAFVTAVYTITNEKLPQSAATPTAIDQTTTSAGIGIRFGF